MTKREVIESLTASSVAELDAFMSRSYAPVRTTQPTRDAFIADIRMHRGADVMVGFVCADAHVLERTERMIGGSNQEFVNIGILGYGRGVVTQFDRSVEVTGGDLFMSDPDVPYSLEFTETFELIFFLFPRRLIGLSTSRLHALAARRLEISDPLRRLSLSFIEALERDLSEFAPRTATRLLRNSIELLATVVDEAAVGHAVASVEGDRSMPLVERARAYIDVNLADSRLTPQRVADALYISARHLHGAFVGEGVTVAEYIRNRRVERCRQDLLDPDLAALPIGEIGARWGFDDASHFSRTFRRVEGVPPSEYRARHL